MLEAIKLILETGMHNSRDIQTEVKKLKGVKSLKVSCNNFMHLQELLASVLNIKNVMLEEYDSARETDECFFIISIF